MRVEIRRLGNEIEDSGNIADDLYSRICKIENAIQDLSIEVAGKYGFSDSHERRIAFADIRSVCADICEAIHYAEYAREHLNNGFLKLKEAEKNLLRVSINKSL